VREPRRGMEADFHAPGPPGGANPPVSHHRPNGDGKGAPVSSGLSTPAQGYREREGIAFNAYCDGDGAIMYKQACALGCEGIVSKRLGSAHNNQLSWPQRVATHPKITRISAIASTPRPTLRIPR
jgi:hypothetical protein